MKKLSTDKNVEWIAYVQSGKLAQYLGHLKLTEHAVKSILDKMGGEVYKDDYLELTKCLGTEALQRLNVAIRSAHFATKNNNVNISVNIATHTKLVAVKALIAASSVDDTLNYLIGKSDEKEKVIDDTFYDSPIQSPDNTQNESSESRLYNRLTGLDKRIFGHHYLKSVAPQLAIRARKSSFVISKAKAFKKAHQLGIEKNALWALDFGDEKRKVYPLFQFKNNISASADFHRLIAISQCYPDQMWFAALRQNLAHIDDQALFFNLIHEQVNADVMSILKTLLKR